MDFHDITLSDVERLLRALQEARPGDPELIKQIINRVQPNQELSNARVTIGSLLKLLKQTGGSTILPDDIVALLNHSDVESFSLVHATVVSINEHEPTPEDFEWIGARVRIRRDSIYANQNDGEGIVKGSADVTDCVFVRWLNNGDEMHYYRTGKNGVCDLELAEPLPAVAIVRFVDGHMMQISLPADRTLQPGDTVMVDQQIKQIRFHSLVHATVVSINFHEPTPEDFERIGTRVRICRDSQFANQNDGEGIVQRETSSGWVNVRWLSNDDNDHNYKTGRDGECDLELVDRLPPTITVNTDAGKKLEVLAPTNYSVKIGERVTVNRETMQIVIAE